jgi:hypothetical protein
VKAGDFSVQLPTTWTGHGRKIADAFNDIVAANQTMAKELKRVGQVVGKEGRTRERTKFEQAKGSWGRWRLGQHADRRPAAAHDRSHRRHRGVAQGT